MHAFSETTAGRDVAVDTLDGVSLDGTLFEPEGAADVALLVAPGTGIPRRFYARFAAYAAAHGFAVLTLDYRGVGGSAPEVLQGYEARYRDWGQRDLPAAIDWLDTRYSDLPLAVVGHSTGGQQLGLASNVGRVRAAVFVAVSTGYWGGMPMAYKLMTLGLWKAWLPLASRLYGYSPAKKIGWGENLPVGVAREWAAWCLDPAYLGAYLDPDDPNRPADAAVRPTPDGAAFGPSYYHEARFPILAYYFPDDPISTRANVPPMLRLYRAAQVETEWIEPADLGVREVGHLGFFRSDVGGALWSDALGWLAADV